MKCGFFWHLWPAEQISDWLDLVVFTEAKLWVRQQFWAWSYTLESGQCPHDGWWSQPQPRSEKEAAKNFPFFAVAHCRNPPKMISRLKNGYLLVFWKWDRWRSFSFYKDFNANLTNSTLNICNIFTAISLVWSNANFTNYNINTWNIFTAIFLVQIHANLTNFTFNICIIFSAFF